MLPCVALLVVVLDKLSLQFAYNILLSLTYTYEIHYGDILSMHMIIHCGVVCIQYAVEAYIVAQVCLSYAIVA